MEDSIMHSAEPFAVPQTAEDFITLNGERLDYSVCAEEIRDLGDWLSRRFAGG